MKSPLIRRSPEQRNSERGVTMALVAVSMVAIIAIAALSIDVITLYLAREEAQRTADAAAVAAAQVLSLSGVTGDPGNVQGSLPSAPWPLACAAATQMAQSVANQNSVGRTTPNTVTVTFLFNGSTVNCASPSTGFVINPQVQVQIIRQNLPTFFSRIWRTGSNRVSATATAEAFNPSNSASAAGVMVPVSPRCVKPWIIANKDPGNPGAAFVSPIDGSIVNPGIQFPPGTGVGVIGEQFALTIASGCAAGTCIAEGTLALQPGEYVPALVTPPATAVPACAAGTNPDYATAIGGCDQGTVYACGAATPITKADLSFNPSGGTGDTSSATQCLIHQPGSGEDILDPGFFPYRINAGTNNPVVNSGAVSNSSSIVTIPIYDGNPLANVTQPPVVIVGFLQAFVNSVSNTGNLNITVFNVAGCSSNADFTTAVTGTSPVPVRLITPQ